MHEIYLIYCKIENFNVCLLLRCSLEECMYIMVVYKR